ncbi:hypothetical protein PR202_ga15088 [Eleusine coracana subsp. coracana]|uniref:PGG domain-containing protein n=1 Tax=Eleusine coracana subsp. coracana TaxID=191504 RepID=A0AAV5CI36_ELECO|nr:hypothetical protein PR202_ga15088 [Eleusine coracana subsp. coracana]
MNSAFAGLIGVLSNVSKITGVAADSVKTAAYAAIFFMFATAIVGVFVVSVSKKVPEVTRPLLRRLLVTAIGLANAFLLCSLAGAAFAAAFVFLRYRVFAAFAPLVITAIICLLLRYYCVASDAGEADDERENQDRQERIKATEDLASKVTMATFAAIMAVLAASPARNNPEPGTFGSVISQWFDHRTADDTSVRTCGLRTRDMIMLILTSAFVCGFGFMLIAAAPASTRALLAPAIKVLEWSSVSLLAATAVAVYGVVVETM